MNMEVNSVIGVINQMPSDPSIWGSVTAAIRNNTNDFKKEIMAEIFPFPNAVKNAEAKMLIPANRKPIENTCKPLTAIS